MTRRSIFAAAILALGAGTALAHSYTKGAIGIGHAWALPGATETRAAVPLLNRGRQADALVAARSPLARVVSFRQGDETAARIDLRPGAPVAMRPQALHLRLEGLQRALAHGDRVPLVLVFERAGEIAVDVWIEPFPYAGPPPR